MSANPIPKPKPKPAVFYNQDCLSDFVTKGGSITDLFADEIKEGNRVVVVQKPDNAPEVILAVIESEDDLNRLRETVANMQKWLGNALGGA